MHSKTSFLFVAVLLSGLFLFSCTRKEIDGYSGMGKTPVYAALETLNDIRSLPPQDVAESGPIFLLDTLFFMVEQKKGIHVFNIKDSANIQNLVFLKIPAVTDFTIAGSRLYADSWRDLVTIDISDLQNIQLLDRQLNAFEPLLFPPLFNGPFECVDESKGAVIGWEDAELDNALCYTVF